jgi:hypothetical protein
MHIDINFFQATSLVIAFLAVLMGSIVPIMLYNAKNQRGERKAIHGHLASLSTGQTQIVTSLSTYQRDIDDLFTHKEDCLKRRTDCERDFLTKKEHSRIHETH